MDWRGTGLPTLKNGRYAAKKKATNNKNANLMRKWNADNKSNFGNYKQVNNK